jgi:hypothetical protein
MNNKNIIRIIAVTAFILAIPLIAMQFTKEVDWGVLDFAIIGTLLIGTGLIYELVVKRIKNNTHRVFFALVLLGALFLTWAELAVGIFGTPFAGS